MQVNISHSPDIHVELTEHTIKPSQLFAVKKSASSYDIRETEFTDDVQNAQTAVTDSVSNAE